MTRVRWPDKYWPVPCTGQRSSSRPLPAWSAPSSSSRVGGLPSPAPGGLCDTLTCYTQSHWHSHTAVLTPCHNYTASSINAVLFFSSLFLSLGRLVTIPFLKVSFASLITNLISDKALLSPPPHHQTSQTARFVSTLVTAGVTANQALLSSIVQKCL